MPLEKRILFSAVAGMAAYFTGVVAVFIIAGVSDFEYMALPLLISAFMPLRILPPWLFVVLPCAILFSEKNLLWKLWFSFPVGGIVGFCLMFPPWQLASTLHSAEASTYGRAMLLIYGIPASVVGACCFGYQALLLRYYGTRKQA